MGVRSNDDKKERKNVCAGTAFRTGSSCCTIYLYNLICNARACVANDSGIMHLAAAVGLPGVAVFGPTDYRATGPVSDKWSIVFDKEPCAPCFKRVCPHGTRNCMKKLEAAEVIKALEELAVL